MKCHVNFNFSFISGSTSSKQQSHRELNIRTCQCSPHGADSVIENYTDITRFTVWYDSASRLANHLHVSLFMFALVFAGNGRVIGIVARTCEVVAGEYSGTPSFISNWAEQQGRERERETCFPNNGISNVNKMSIADSVPYRICYINLNSINLGTNNNNCTIIT